MLGAAVAVAYLPHPTPPLLPASTLRTGRAPDSSLEMPSPCLHCEGQQSHSSQALQGWGVCSEEIRLSWVLSLNAENPGQQPCPAGGLPAFPRKLPSSEANFGWK